MAGAQRADGPCGDRRTGKVGIVAASAGQDEVGPPPAGQGVPDQRRGQAASQARQSMPGRRAGFDAQARVSTPVGQFCSSGDTVAHETLGCRVGFSGSSKGQDCLGRVPNVGAALQAKDNPSRRARPRQGCERIGNDVVDGARRKLARQQVGKRPIHRVPQDGRREPNRGRDLSLQAAQRTTPIGLAQRQSNRQGPAADRWPLGTSTGRFPSAEIGEGAEPMAPLPLVRACRILAHLDVNAEALRELIL
jgi:hypothetical protein